MTKKRKKDITEGQSDLMLYKQQQRNELIDIEKFYVNGKLENLDELVNLKKREVVNKLEEYQKLMVKEIKDEDGNVIETIHKEFNPYLVSTYFFKSLNPLSNIEPNYSAEKLAIVWDLYMYLIEQVNINIGMMHPTISNFCKFAGISVNTFKNYKSKGSLEMQILANKISDETFDSNVLLAQTKYLSNRSTELRVKVENEVQEKPQVKVNVNVNEEVDLNQIANRLNELSNFKNNRNKYEPIEVEVNE